MDSKAALGIIGDRIHHIWDIVNGGWEDYVKQYPESVRLLHCSTTRASIVHDHQVARASQFAQEHQALSVKIIDINRLKILLIENIAIRFKKFDAYKNSSNVKTNQVRRFSEQDTIGEVETACNLEAGYILSNDENDINEIYLVRPNGLKAEPFWSIELKQAHVELIHESLFPFTKQPEQVFVDDEAEVKPRKKVIPIDVVKNEDKS